VITERPAIRNFLRGFAATCGVALITAALVWARIDSTVVGLLFLAAVVWVATRVGLRLSLYVALLCALCFNYFFLPPLRTLRLAGPREWLELLAFVASSVVVGRVAELARRQTRQAEQRRADVERLYSLSQEMMLHEDAVRLARDLPHLIERCFALEVVVLYVRDQDRFYGSVDGLAAAPRDALQARLRALTQGHGANTDGPEGFTVLALMLGLKNIGALAWKPDTLSREAATAVGAQVAIALARAQAIETYTRMEAAREGERLRTALIDSLTHELRTPLTGIRAAATTLVQGEGLDDAARRDLAELLDEESARLDRLIGEAVEMAEIDARVVRVSPVPQYARAILDHAVEESRAALSGHPVPIDVEGPDSPAWFDPHLLSRVLRHLIENAARYSPPGSPIELRSRRAGSRLEFSVEDHGQGIDSADLPLIFEKFYRGRQGNITGKGTGMGLAIVRAILEAHGGGIEVETAAGQGSKFRFWVPLVERQPDHPADVL
jgi:two-component system, OmpR family, sensor histidine kinase KdpD